MDEETFNLLCEYVDMVAYHNVRSLELGNIQIGFNADTAQIRDKCRERLREALVSKTIAITNPEYAQLDVAARCKCGLNLWQKDYKIIETNNGSIHSHQLCLLKK